MKRLNELAQRCWPSAFIECRDLNFEGAESSVAALVPGEHGDYIQVGICNQPRALDALEAALCVLADEPYSMRLEACKKDCEGYWEQRRRADELEQLYAVQKSEGLLQRARRERDDFERALDALKTSIERTVARAEADGCDSQAFARELRALLK